MPQGYPPTMQSGQPLPAYERPQKKASRGMLRLTVILLLLLLVLGTSGYFVFKYVSSRGNSGGSNTTTSTSTSSSVKTAPIKTTPINATVTYASVDITILNAQQATSFADDSNTTTPGVVRLNIHAVQTGVDDTNGGSSIDPYYDYPSSFALILQDGSKVSPVGEKDATGPTRKGNQTTWVDFPIPSTINMNQLTLQIGKDTEAQMDIPLTGHADLSQYQPKQVSPNTSVQYAGMTWTLTTATARLSDSGAQADKGKRFITLSLKIDNPTSNNLSAYPPDYVRLQFSGTIIVEHGDTLPTPAAGTNNATGLVAFLVPQDVTAFTLVLLPNGVTGATSQATIPFQIP
jgi:heme/copper-type cytochrome/quinol oxidase subunit 2